jgi:protein AbiQ
MLVKFYIVENNYIEHLRSVDGHVYQNKAGRPYVGVLFEVNGCKFLAPLTSPKPKHDDIPDKSPLIYKMHELGNETNKLGLVQINNMIPVPDSEMELLDMSKLDAKYKVLLDLQQQFLRKNSVEFQKKAKKLYAIVKGGKAVGLIKRCCDFQALEKAMEDYVSKNMQAPSQDKLEALAGLFAKK